MFVIKLDENFRHKVRCVGDGRRTDTPPPVTYSSVVSRDSVWICLLLVAFNDLDIKFADIKNSYLPTLIREKLYIWAGPEFGQDAGKFFIIVRAIYGLKSSGASFRSLLAEHLNEIGLRFTVSDPDVWKRKAIKPDGEFCYEYALVYIDDIMIVALDPSQTMRQMKEKSKLKGDNWDAPDIIPRRKDCWKNAR